MTRTPLLIVLAAAAALAGCNSGNRNIVAGEPNEEQANAAKTPVALPPSIVASKIYRCKDNHVIYVDWLSDNKSANIRAEQGGAPNQVTAAEAGKPMTNARGFSLTGSASGPSISLTLPGRGPETCRA